MEPLEKTLSERFRYRLILGKFPVIKLEKDFLGNTQATVDLQNRAYFVMQLPATADVKEGDLLTLYTEVLSNAKSEQTPVQ